MRIQAVCEMYIVFKSDMVSHKKNEVLRVRGDSNKSLGGSRNCQI